MLIDEVTIKIKAGDGGDGLVHFYADRWRPKGGPDGGDGGDGGQVYTLAVPEISRLQQFRHAKEFSAQDGQKGGPNQRTGRNGQDLVLELPLGTIISYDNGTQIELTKIGQKELLAKGGKGGVGNYSMRSSTNQTPQEFRPGLKKEWRTLRLELKLIAQVGLIGLPNVGKSSILNELTSASARVANYAFTTLEPNLGVTKSNLILADIPGLIEGASEGKGLGSKFLRHIERTQILLHCVAADSVDPMADYQTIRQELNNYSSKLATKPEIVIITKSDTKTPQELAKIKKQLKAKLVVSIIDQDSLKQLNDLITKTIASQEV